MNLWEVYSKGKEILKNHEIQTFQTDAYFIFQKSFGLDRAQLLVNKKTQADSSKTRNFLNMISKRAERIPLQYILGSWEFLSLEFEVGEGVLIPRGDTEILVNSSAEILSKLAEPHIVDLCSGTGCVAISIEKKLKNNPKITAVELSKKAFKYLEKNIKNHNSKITAMSDDVFSCHESFENNSLDAIVSNPPYIPTGNLNLVQAEVKFEPKMALDGGSKGLYFYKNICKYWIEKLKSGGMLAFEVGINQSEEVKQLMASYGMSFLEIKRDINEIDRVVLGIKT